MGIYDLKPRFQDLLRPSCRALAAAGVTANQVTLLALALSLLTGGLILGFAGARWTLLLLPAALFLRMALNALDGMLAREHNMRTRLGAVLNELGDVASDAVLYLPLAVLPGMPAAVLVIVTILAMISEMAGVVAVQIGAARCYDGPMGKSDRAVVFGALGLLLGLGTPTGAWLTVVLTVTALLLLLTIHRRARHALGATP